MGAEGHISHLRRTRVGSFETNLAWGLEKLEDLVHRGAPSAALLRLDAALDDIPGLRMTTEETHRLKQGQAVLVLPDRIKTLHSQDLNGDGMVKALGALGDLIALCHLEGMRLNPVRVFQY